MRSGVAMIKTDANLCNFVYWLLQVLHVRVGWAGATRQAEAPGAPGHCGVHWHDAVRRCLLPGCCIRAWRAQVLVGVQLYSL